MKLEFDTLKLSMITYRIVFVIGQLLNKKVDLQFVYFSYNIYFFMINNIVLCALFVIEKLLDMLIRLSYFDYQFQQEF